MDSGVSRDRLKKGEDPAGKLDDEVKVSVVVEAIKDVEPPFLTTVAVDSGPSLGPITPNPDREVGDFLFDFKSPLTLVSSPPNLVCVDSHGIGDVSGSTPQTPKEGVFDPFAPGPDEMVMAPQCKKYFDESRTSVARRLNFGSSGEVLGDGNHGNDAENLSDEEMLLESVYGTLLEAIVSKQTEGVLAQILPLESDSDGFKTPTSVPHLNGVAETCPGAPMKPTRKVRNIDQCLCRKLEF